MSAGDRALLATEIVLAAVLLAGLLVRRHSRACSSFAAYAGSIIVFESLILFWPSRFFTFDFWLLKEATQAALKIAVLAELWSRVFGANLPTARARVAQGLVVILVATAAAVASLASQDVLAVAAQILPRVLYGIAVGFAFVLGAVLWYNVPLHPLHKAILLGYVPYLFVFTLVLQLMQSLDWHGLDLANRANPIAFLLLLAVWARVAWRPYREAAASAEVVAFLRPWAVERRQP